MNRRNLMTLLGGVAAWPVAARAQQDERTRRIGALIGGEESDPVRQLWVAGLRAALQMLGWTDGYNMRMDLRWAAADNDRARVLAADLLAVKPDVLFADNTYVAAALQRTTASVPIVFARITDPVASGFVRDLARPSGNMTGFSNYEPSILAKFVQFTRDIAPDVTRVAVIASTKQWQGESGKRSLDVVLRAASLAGLKSAIVAGDSAREFENVVVEFAREPNGGLIVPGDPVTTAHRQLIIALAGRYKMPIMGTYPYLAADVALLTYGAAIREQYQGAASYIDRILKGEKPGDLPVQQPTRYELKVNLRTAKALGLTVPPSLLATADEVIE
jgi:putative ABC transport system substrate-binding protein